jgi:RNA-directed DNA polymerase
MSPLLSNIVLDEFDRELERSGLRFARYADDCNV